MFEIFRPNGKEPLNGENGINSAFSCLASTFGQAPHCHFELCLLARIHLAQKPKLHLMTIIRIVLLGVTKHGETDTSCDSTNKESFSFS